MSEQLTGNEEFTLHDIGLGITISDFWSWAYSDLLNNTYRGVLAEFLVFSALIPSFHLRKRDDWLPYDIASPSGRRTEVKSAAYLQSWTKEYYSQIIFDIAPKRAWTPEQGYSPERKRNSDLYVFCVYTALTKDKSLLNLNLWDFYVLPTAVLNKKAPKQKKIGLQSLLKLKPIKTDYASLGTIIESIDLRQDL